MTNRIRWAATTAALAGLLMQVACSQSQVITTLDLVVTAADTAVTVLQATGTLPPGTASLITGYLNQVTAGVQFATTELASSDSNAVKASKIVGYFAMIAVPNLPPGTVQTVVAVVQAVANAVANFLATLPNMSLTAADQKALPMVAAHNIKVRFKLILVNRN